MSGIYPHSVSGSYTGSGVQHAQDLMQGYPSVQQSPSSPTPPSVWTTLRVYLHWAAGIAVDSPSTSPEDWALAAIMRTDVVEFFQQFKKKQEDTLARLKRHLGDSPGNHSQNLQRTLAQARLDLATFALDFAGRPGAKDRRLDSVLGKLLIEHERPSGRFSPEKVNQLGAFIDSLITSSIRNPQEDGPPGRPLPGFQDSVA